MNLLSDLGCELVHIQLQKSSTLQHDMIISVKIKCKLAFAFVGLYHMFIKLLVRSKVYKVYADGFCSLDFQSIKACMYRLEKMLKVSRKRTVDSEKNSKVFSKRNRKVLQKSSIACMHIIYFNCL